MQNKPEIFLCEKPKIDEQQLLFNMSAISRQNLMKLGEKKFLG